MAFIRRIVCYILIVFISMSDGIVNEFEVHQVMNVTDNDDALMMNILKVHNEYAELKKKLHKSMMDKKTLIDNAIDTENIESSGEEDLPLHEASISFLGEQAKLRTRSDSASKDEAATSDRTNVQKRIKILPTLSTASFVRLTNETMQEFAKIEHPQIVDLPIFGAKNVNKRLVKNKTNRKRTVGFSINRTQPEMDIRTRNTLNNIMESTLKKVYYQTNSNSIADGNVGNGPKVVKSVDMSLPAWNDDNKQKIGRGILSSSTRRIEKSLKTQSAFVRKIDKKFSELANVGKPEEPKRAASNCLPPFAQPLTLDKVEQMSSVLGLQDLAQLLAEATDYSKPDINQLSQAIELKRRLISKLGILLSLAESRQQIFDAFQQQKIILDKLLEEQSKPVNDIDELNAAVQQLLSDERARRLIADEAKRFKRIQGSTKLKKNKIAKILGKKGIAMMKEKNKNATSHRQIKLKINNTFTSQLKPSEFHAQRGIPTRSSNQIPIRPPTDDEVLTDRSTFFTQLNNDLINMSNKSVSTCALIECTFENNDLCHYESSHDEITRIRRGIDESDLLQYIFRAWSIWFGRYSDTDRQIDIGPGFRNNRNNRFAGAFLEPDQAAILTTSLGNRTLRPTSIRFRVYEATRGMQLRVCCDRNCPLQTERGLYRGHRHWLRKTVICPAGTKTISFECLNNGNERGTCGIDDVFISSSECNHLFNGPDDA